MKKVFILILVMINLIGCEQNIQRKNTNLNTDSQTQIDESNVNEKTPDIKNNIEINNNNRTIQTNYESPSYNIKLIKEKTYPEHKYYSPDRKNYIRITFSSFGSLFTKKLYLNESSELIEIIGCDTDNKKDVPVYWLSNNQVLIRGQYILNIDDNKKTKLKIDAFCKTDESFDYEVTYAVNPSGTKIAYLFTEDNYLKIFLYDTNTHKYAQIQDYKFDTLPYDTCLLFDDKNNLYYNIGNGDKFQIMKYNYKEEENKLFFKENYTIIAMSSNSRYYILCYWGNGDYKIYDSVEDNIIFSAQTPYWYYNNDSFIYYDTESESINIFLYESSIEEKVINIKELNIVDKPYIIFDFINNYYTAFIDNFPLDFEVYQPSGVVYSIEY
ncbi:hypothetical protein [Vallitalea sp.]|jgi:hypothetical protein|uniref:hypothetical protein n=1 Tax=Vallitalea sp. TaxID=1882829 RepID=UPI0025DD436F|nr:hypothetical protein [Vallitalea sp.]MCT4687508.1 hypothetical protein [Vallitalea sp.]